MYKKLSLFLLIILVIQSDFFAQNGRGQLAVSGGATYSIFRNIHKGPFREFETQFKFTVGQQLHIDCGLMRRFSLGMGLTHHTHVLNISNYFYYKGPEIIYENPTQKISVNSVYVRLLVHLLDPYILTDNSVDLYWGFSQGAIYYNSKSNSADPSFFKDSDSYKTIPTILGGVRYYPTTQFGIHVELAIPTNYFISMGLVFRV